MVFRWYLVVVGGVWPVSPGIFAKFWRILVDFDGFLRFWGGPSEIFGGSGGAPRGPGAGGRDLGGIWLNFGSLFCILDGFWWILVVLGGRGAFWRCLGGI